MESEDQRKKQNEDESQTEQHQLELKLLQINSFNISDLMIPYFSFDTSIVFPSRNHISVYSLPTKKQRIVTQLKYTESMLGFKSFRSIDGRTLITYLTQSKGKFLNFYAKQDLQKDTIYSCLISLQRNQKVIDYSLMRDTTVLGLILEISNYYYKIKMINLIDQSINQKTIDYKANIINGIDNSVFYMNSGKQIIMYSFNLNIEPIVVFESKKIVAAWNIENNIVIVGEESIFTYEMNERIKQRLKKVDIEIVGNVVLANIDINGEYMVLIMKSLDVMIIKVGTMKTVRFVSIGDCVSLVSNVYVSDKGLNLIVCGERKNKQKVVVCFNTDFYLCRHQHFYSFFNVLPFVQQGMKASVSWHRYRKIFCSITGLLLKFGNTLQTLLQQPKTHSIHPQGLFIAIGFQHLIKLYGIKSQNLQLIQSINAQSVQRLEYSPYGNIIFAQFKSEIRLYKSYTLQKIHSITLRFPATEILGFQIQQNGALIFIYDNATGATVFNYQTLKVIRQFRLPIIGYPVCYDFISEIVIQVDKTRVVLSQGDDSNYKQTSYDDNAIITCIKINKQLGRIFLGTSNGQIRCHFWFDVPMKQFIYNYTRILLFNCGVHSIEICNGNQQLVTWSFGGQTAKVRLGQQVFTQNRRYNKYYLLQSKQDTLLRQSQMTKCENDQLKLSQLITNAQSYKQQLQRKYQRQEQYMHRTFKLSPSRQLQQYHNMIKAINDKLDYFDIDRKKSELESQYFVKLKDLRNKRQDLEKQKQAIGRRNSGQLKYLSKNLQRKRIIDEQQVMHDSIVFQQKVEYGEQHMACFNKSTIYITNNEEECIFTSLDQDLVKTLSQSQTKYKQLIKKQQQIERKNKHLKQQIKNLEWKMICSRQLKQQIEFSYNDVSNKSNDKKQVIELLKNQAHLHSKYMDYVNNNDKMMESEIKKIKEMNITKFMENMTRVSRQELQKMDDMYKELNIKVTDVEGDLKQEATILIDLNKKVEIKSKKLQKLKTKATDSCHQLYISKYSNQQFYKHLSNLTNQYSSKQTHKRPPQQPPTFQKQLMQRMMNINQKKLSNIRFQLKQQTNSKLFKKHNTQNQNLTVVFNTLNHSAVNNQKTVKGLQYRINKIRLSNPDKNQQKMHSTPFKTPFVEYQQKKSISKKYRSINVSFNS